MAQQEADEAAPDRWHVSAEFSYTDQTGNRVLRVLAAGLSFSHLEKEQFELDGTIETRYGKSEGETVALNHRASLGFDFRPVERWSPFLFTQAEHDRIKRLDLRLSGGAGAKYTVISDADRERDLSLSLAMLASYEDYGQEPEAAVQGSESLRARWSLRLRGQDQIRPGVTARHTTFYQPIVDEMASYLLRSQTGLRVLLTERLALSVEYQWDRDSQPPENVSPDDRLLKTGIIIEF